MLSFLPDILKLSIIFLILQLFCIFISVKFYISAFDLLKTVTTDKKTGWIWLLKLLS
ncbi:hypothetical protein D088_780002 [Salmonella enterica subsp. houtenae serovar 16:z4,z32:-- str. RKS3027]|nr:hypothetical protein D088_780002 [Salmonella enterica subsp. houtenae serovar 16:z4,z32:-- str. RKS3027]